MRFVIDVTDPADEHDVHSILSNLMADMPDSATLHVEDS